MINSGFSEESLDNVWNLLYAEGQVNPLEGQCNQKKKREKNKQRTPAQREADQQRAQQQRGQNTVSPGVRSEAAKKAAETRKKCKNSSQQQVQTNQYKPS
jgi:hypothetical protein